MRGNQTWVALCLSLLACEAQPTSRSSAPGDDVGVVQRLVYDFHDGSSEIRSFLRMRDGQRIPLETTNFPTGTRLSVRDALKADLGTTVPLSASVTSVAGGVTSLAANLDPDGDHRALVILMNFSDDTSEPTTVSQVQSAMFSDSDSIAEYWLHQSAGRASVSGDVVGWWTTSAASVVDCDPAVLLDELPVLASAHRVDLGAYEHLVIMTNATCSGFAAVGTTGENPGLVVTYSGGYSARSARHELGHNLGFLHTRRYTGCTGTQLYGAGCTAVEYGHIADAMGVAQGLYSPPQLERVGWIGQLDGFELTDVTTSGTYFIAPMTDASTAPHALRIARTADGTSALAQYYYVEARQPTSFDSFLSGKTGVTGGVLLTVGNPVAGSALHMIDTKTSTTTPNDAALLVGETYSDTVNGVSITVDSADALGVQMTVALSDPAGPCVRAAPILTLTEDATTALAVDELRTFSLKVENNDSGCAPTSFVVTPTGLADTFSTWAAPGHVLVPSGAAQSVPVLVRASTGTAATTHAFVVGVTGESAAHVASVNGGVTVTTCVRARPSILAPSVSTRAGTAASRTLTFTNNDTSACGSSTFELGAYAPSGWSSSLVSGDLTLAPGASATRTLSVTPPAATAVGTYPTGIYLSSLTWPAYRRLETAETTVALCTRNKPSVVLSPANGSSAPGGTVAYTAQVTNHDSSVCASQTFALSRTVVSGFSSTLSSSSLSIAAGATKTVSFSSTAPTTASAGTYGVSVTATGPSSGASSGTASHEVLCVRATPTLSISPSSQTVQAGESTVYDVTVTSNDNAACSAIARTLTVSQPSGWNQVLAQTSLAPSPGASATTTLTLTAPAIATAGSYATSVTVDSAPYASATSALVSVSVCTRAAPSLTLAPDTQSALAGTALTYSATVTNRDSTTCESSTFALTRGVPSGWGSSSAVSVTLAPGASSTTSVVVTSASAASADSYPVSLRAVSAASGQATASASYQVLPGCVRSAPSLTVWPPSQSGAAGTTLSYLVTITNHDSAPCAAATLALSDSVPAGWTSALPSSLNLAPGASAAVTWTITSVESEPSGTYTLVATAIHAASGSASDLAGYVLTAMPVPLDGGPELAQDAGVEAGPDASVDAAVTAGDDAAVTHGGDASPDAGVTADAGTPDDAGGGDAGAAPEDAGGAREDAGGGRDAGGAAREDAGGARTDSGAASNGAGASDEASSRDEPREDAPLSRDTSTAPLGTTDKTGGGCQLAHANSRSHSSATLFVLALLMSRRRRARPSRAPTQPTEATATPPCSGGE